VDAGRLTGRTDLAGELAGTVDVQGTVANLGEPFRLEALSGRGTVTLEPSAIGPLALERAHLEASLADGQAEVAMFEAVGPRLNATASGRVALLDTGASDLKYSVSMTQLADLGPLVGRSLDGRVLLEGTVTGNRTDLASTGTAAFSGLAVADAFDALTLRTAFDARLPNLDMRALTASFKAQSTLFRVAGRTFPTLDATVEIAEQRYRFEVTANETGRTITAAGDLTTVEGAREVTVNRLALVTGPATWTLADTGPVQVRYDPAGLVTLPREITLVNNGQQLSAQGSLALTDAVTGSMDVTVSGVDLTELGALLLSKRQLAGTLIGDARITGSRTTRDIVGNVKVLAGIVDGYAFQSFDTLLAYRGEEARIDAILIQSPGSTLEATGTVPFALDRGVLTDRPLSFDITSAGIDLAVLEAANTGLVDASGQLVVDLHITGTGTEPVGRGSIKVVKGAFTVRPTGVRYTEAAIDATVEGSDVQVTQLRLLDEDKDGLEGSGRLRFENRAVHDIDFKAQSNNFDVLDNEFGRLSVDATLTLAGTLGAPKIGGLVRLNSGRLEVDQILDRFGSAPYEPLGDPAAAAAPPANPPEKVEPMAPLALNLTVHVPDNLVLRGRDIRAGNGGVALGDINLTAGGDFTVTREGTSGLILVGTISTVRGSYDFQGRRFEVQRDGQITFYGQQPIDPSLDVAAERVISGIVARVNVGGTMRSPELMLSSQPPLDQTDILSLIVFNQPANRLTQGQATNVGERAAQVAGGFVAAPLSDTLGRALRVDIFELDPSDDTGQGPSVTVGQQVGERLFMKFRQIFGTRDLSEFQLEYQLAKFLRLQGSIADGQTSANRSLTRRVERGGIDLVVYFSY
jgi:autotransporter translocation and assembly factor TamB